MTNQQQQEWFEQLHNRNLKASEVFMLPEFANVFRGVIDKYSDSAHFIYELLQNADDAGATNVSMVLEPDKFIFTHNGNTRFNISDPANVVHDRASGMLGHINSICYIGFSSKSGTGIESLKQNKIGKFGVGFKAVFQYTTTPEIYDNPFCFRIENYIVPCAISSEPYQKEGHTVIVIPFNRKDIDSKDSFSEIYHKLKNLNYPQLFLNNILSVSWNTPSENNVISKSLDDEGQSHGLQYRLYALSESKSEKKKILLLKKSLKVIDQGVHDIMIGYYLDKGRIVTKETRNIYCFFPTNENIETCYVIHAPFALVDNRQQIKRNNNINDFLFEAVAQLAASSLLVLRDWTGYDKMKLLGDNIIDIIKYNTLSIDNTYLKYGYIGKMFEKHYKSILDKESIFLSRNGIYLPKTSAWWTDKETRDLIDENQIRSLFKIPRIFIQPDFVLCSVNRTELDTSNIKISKFDGAEFSRRITSDFMKKQTIEWLARFYTYIKDKNLIRYYEINKGNKSTAPMRHANIVKVQSGEFVPAYNTSNELQVFYSTDANTNPKESVNTSLLESCAPFRELIKDLGVKTPNQLDKLKIKIAVHQQLSQKENNELLISIINYYNSCARAFQNEIIQLIKERYKFCTEDVNNKGRLWWVEPTKMYEDNQILKDYFIASGIDRRYFIYREFYAKAISTIGERAFNEFLLELGTKMRPEYSRGMVKLTESEVLHRQHNRVADKEISMIDGLDRIFMSTYNKLITEKLSHYIWDLLIYHCNRHSDFFDNNLSTYHLYNRDNVQDWGRSSLIDAIRKPAWLYINGERRSFAIGIYKEELSDNGYSYDGTLISKLKIESKPDIKEAKVISEMSKETREAFELGKEAKNFGLNSSGELALAMAKLHAYEAKEEAELAAIKERQARNERRKQDEDAFQNIPRRVLSKALRLQDLEAPDNERAKFSKNNTTQSSNNIDDI